MKTTYNDVARQALEDALNGAKKGMAIDTMVKVGIAYAILDVAAAIRGKR